MEEIFNFCGLIYRKTAVPTVLIRFLKAVSVPMGGTQGQVTRRWRKLHKWVYDRSIF
jgi:hypothetical protein